MPTAANRFWRFFTSVKLALMTLFVLAATSIFGTVIKQNKPAAFYVEGYGTFWARILEALDLTAMYSSWWFIGLLLLFALNLIICSIERLPGVWRTVFQDNSTLNAEQIGKMPCSHSLDIRLSLAAATEAVERALTDSGWKKPRRHMTAETGLLFVQQGAWTRLAVYVVHLSILVILAGAAAGFLFGFKAYVFLPEGRATDTVFLQENQEPVPLGFSLYVNRATLEFYPNGMIRQYRADLTVTDPEREAPYRKSIIVNDPLSYRNLSFYLGDFYPMDEFFVFVSNRTTGAEQAFRTAAGVDITLPDSAVTARIEELSRDPEGKVHRARISLAATAANPASEFWISDLGTASVSLAGEEVSIAFQQLTAVLLLINKDPGVMIVYAGFILLVLGLFVSFFLSHRRIWVSLATSKKGTRVIVGGYSNKNRPGFEKSFHKVTAQIPKKP